MNLLSLITDSKKVKHDPKRTKNAQSKSVKRTDQIFRQVAQQETEQERQELILANERLHRQQSGTRH